MSSLIKILLQSNCRSPRDFQTQTSSLNANNKDKSDLGQVTRLVYSLLWRQKFELLETIFTNLKNEEEKAQQKGLKNAQSNKQNVGLASVLESLNLNDFFQFIKSNQPSEIDHALRNEQTLDKCIYDLNIDVQKLLRMVDFFVDFVFAERRINQQQVHQLMSIINNLHQRSNQNNMRDQSNLLLTLDKWQLLLTLAQQTTKNEYKQKSDYKCTEQNDDKTKIISTQLQKESVEKWLFSSEQQQECLTLLQLYKRHLPLHSSSLNVSPLIKPSILPFLIEIHKRTTLQQVQQQVVELLKQIGKEVISQDQSHKQSAQQHQSSQQLICKTLANWAHLNLLGELIQYFSYQLTETNNKKNSSQQSEQQQTEAIAQAQTLITRKHYQTILINLVQFYNSQLTLIKEQLLQQNLSNDIKNNSYLSENKLQQHVANLICFLKWLHPIQQSFPIQQSLNKISRQQLVESIIRSKQVSLSYPESQNQTINSLFYSAILLVTEVVDFFSINRKGLENRILSYEEYQQKVQKVLKRLLSTIYHQSSQRINSTKSLFLKWYVYDSENQGQQIQNHQSSKTKTNHGHQISKHQVTKHFQQLTYNKLKSLIFTQPKCSITSLIQTILHLSQPTQQPLSFFSDTFEYFSPTFNNQFMTFNYIYGEMKDVYFYQNHHYSHTLLMMYEILIHQLTKNLEKENSQENKKLIVRIFNHLRDYIGKYAKDHLLQANSKEFCEYLNLFKFCYITFSKKLLAVISLDQLILTFDLLLNQVIVKENHPSLRQYVEVIMARIYLIIKERTAVEKLNIKRQLPSNQQSENNNQPKGQYNRFQDCRNRMINMLEYDEENIHNLNIGVPILMLLGYELIDFIENNPHQVDSSQRTLPNQHHEQDINDGYGSKQIKTFHEVDIHYILIKYISCHVAYMRTISQYYLSQYVRLTKTNKTDVLLNDLVSFWHSDRDSIKIMTNIAVVIKGFRKQMDVFMNEERLDDFYMRFEKVEEQPSLYSHYFLNRDVISVYQRIINSQALSQNYGLKILLAQKILALKQHLRKIEQQEASKLIQKLNSQKQPKSQPKKYVKSKDPKKPNPQRENKKQQLKQSKQKILEKQDPSVPHQPQPTLSNQQILKKLNTKFKKQYLNYQQTEEPKVIIIATLLQKVHNFGYLVRTLTSHKAMLTVPSPQPFVNPECRQLLPNEDEIDVKVIQIKPRHLESFIKMYQQRGYPLIALEQCSKSVELENTVFPQKYMLLLGNQRIGAPASLLNMADILVEIPQVGKVRSLNVHVSMVICFWEYLKQQKEKEKSSKETKWISEKGVKNE